MFLTSEVLKKYHASIEGIDKFQELYPNGAEISTIIEDERVPSNILHWGYEHLPVSQEEINLYKNRLNIINCINFLKSKDIENCQAIFNSRKCKNSLSVKDSVTVTDSTLIVNSKKVSESFNVYDSKEIRNSKNIIQSHSVYNSNNICVSENIYKSNSIFRSDDILDSIALRRCDHVSRSLFCNDCNNSTNQMFCHDLSEEEFHLFNNPISKDEYSKIFKEITERFPDLSLNLFSSLNALPFGTEKGYTINEIYPIHYKTIPIEFFEFIKTLPGYNPFTLYVLTLDSTFLY